MALAFPSSPSLGQTYQSGSSSTYEWNGSYWFIKQPATIIRYDSVPSASFATTASYVKLVESASYVATASYADYVKTALTASIALTASYAATASYIDPNNLPAVFPYSGTATFSGNLIVSGGSVDFKNATVSASVISGSFVGDGSRLTNITTVNDTDYFYGTIGFFGNTTVSASGIKLNLTEATESNNISINAGGFVELNANRTYEVTAQLSTVNWTDSTDFFDIRLTDGTTTYGNTTRYLPYNTPTASVYPPHVKAIVKTTAATPIYIEVTAKGAEGVPIPWHYRGSSLMIQQIF